MIVAIFSKERGVVRGVMRVTKKQPPAYLASLTKLNFQLRGKEQSDLPSINETSLVKHHFDLASTYLGLSLCQHWAFLLLHSQPENHPDNRVFRLIDHVMSSINPILSPMWAMKQNLYFEAWLLHFCGALPRKQQKLTTPNNSQCPSTNALSPEMKRYLALEDHLLKHLFEQNIEQFTKVELKYEVLAETARVLGQMWEHFLARDLKPRKILLNQLKEKERQHL